jgi:hypothetical protein
VQAPPEEGLGFYPTPYGLAHGYHTMHNMPPAANTVERVVDVSTLRNTTTPVNTDEQSASGPTHRSTAAAISTDTQTKNAPSKTTAELESSEPSKRRQTGDVSEVEDTHTDTTAEILRMLQRISKKVDENAQATAHHAQILCEIANAPQEDHAYYAPASAMDETTDPSTSVKTTQHVDKQNMVLETLEKFLRQQILLKYQ